MGHEHATTGILAMRYLVVGDVAGHLPALDDVLEPFGVSVADGEIPPRTCVVQVGDLVGRSSESAALVAGVERIRRDLPERWLQLAGNHPRPGRFLLTGSVRAELESEMWPGTGRLVPVAMLPMTVAERLGRSPRPFVDRVVAGEPLRPATDGVDLRGYVELALHGGFPELLGLSDRARQRWLESYVEQLLTRDAALVDRGRDPARLRRYVEAYALNSAGLAEDKTLYDAAGIDRRTAVAYEALLANLQVVEAVPAWTTNRLKRLVLSPKRHLVDPALFAGVLGVSTAAVLRDGDLLGRTLDTFVAAQLRAEGEVAAQRARLYHLRREQGRREIDLLLELGAERVIGIEVKADSAPTRDAARHLVWLREELGDRFVAGVVLHTGPATFALDDRVVAAPISTLWSDPS